MCTTILMKFKKTDLKPKLCSYKGNRNSKIFDPNARRLTKIKSNEIVNDFAISWESFDESDSNFFYFKGMEKENNTKTDWTRSHEDCRMKVLLAISWCSNAITNLIFLSFKYVDKS